MGSPRRRPGRSERERQTPEEREYYKRLADERRRQDQERRR